VLSTALEIYVAAVVTLVGALFWWVYYKN